MNLITKLLPESNVLIDLDVSSKKRVFEQVGLLAFVRNEPIGLDEARRTAFREWVHHGGIVHVLKGPSGKHPVFAGDLAELEHPSEHYRYGNGLVIRHDEPRDLGIVGKRDCTST